MDDHQQEISPPAAEPALKLRRMEEEMRDKAVSQYIRQLSQYESLTHPSKGDISAAEKDDSAYFALRTARALVTATAGWAIDHVIGRALQGQEFVSQRLGADANAPDAISQTTEANLHDHELAGAQIHSKDELDPAIARQVLLNLMIADPTGFPPIISRMTVEALRALPFQEVLPIFEPANGARKRRYIELELQLKAVSHVEYRAARYKREGKGTKEISEKEVADAYNVSPKTIRSWKIRTRRGLGQIRFSRAIYTARLWANQVEVPDLDPKNYNHLDMKGLFDPLGLEYDAKSYNEYLKQKIK